MSLESHAERELKLAGIHEKDADYGGMLYEAVMELVRVFAAQGHSGSSASRTIDLFSKVAGYKNLIPITGADHEWNDVGNDMLQNNRVSSVFKEKSTGRAYYLDAIVWRTPNGGAWSGKASGVSSRQYIRSFPFIPKTFYIDVNEEEVAKDDWVFHIKDMKHLEAVRKYYAV
jgi:hypothetical protein